MWLNSGIDSGNIISTETVDIKNCRSLLDAHIKVMEHAHDLYINTVKYLLNTPPPYNSVRQIELGKGNLFLNKMWTPAKRRELLRNWNNRHNTLPKIKPVTIPLPNFKY